ncbi:hypothetical protein [Mycobacterium tuberculosis]|uniref:hypothetical protein n=1 Tax=Mycobacterium tuberculosis TaxID=1773 RepID=UPI0010093AD5|nr:hypothetical protein [Mycobacterium tuberculosis]
MASLRIAEVDPVDRSPNHHASGSVETSSSRSRSFAASFLLDAINAPRVIAGRFASESVRFPAAAPHGSVPSRLPV